MVGLFLSIVAVFLSIAAVFAFQWVTVFPGLGIGTLYHLKKIRVGVAVFCLSSAGTALVIDPSPGQWAVLIAVLVLTPLSGFFAAKKTLVALDDPRHISVNEADLEPQEPVLGFAYDNQARAWPLSLLVPHHLVNDVLGDIPVLAAW